MFSAETDSKEFLQIFVDNCIKKLIILRRVFKLNIYSIIVKYIDKPKDFTMEKYNSCSHFIDNYNIRLNLSFSINYSYYYLSKIRKIIALYFGGKNKYNELVNICWRDIHRPYIIEGLTELNKVYPKCFPNNYPNILSFYNLRFHYIFDFPPRNCRELSIIHYTQYSLNYINYNLWSLVAETSLPENIDHKPGKILCDNVNIEEIITYFQSIY